MFRRSDPEKRIAAVNIYNVLHWEFVPDGRVRRCARLDVINKYGNIGPIVGDYQQARLKVLVFGDSWSAPSDV